MRHVAVYVRASKDETGRSESVRVQEHKGRETAAKLWPDMPVQVYSDNDLTAANEDVHRPGFEAMLAAIRRGEVDEIVCAEQSRLTRRPEELEGLFLVFAHAGISRVMTYRGGALEVKGSKLMMRILGAVDAEEVERMKLRVNDALASRAREGRPSGGICFGYVRARDAQGRPALVPDPVKADAVRFAAEKVLAGWSLSAVAREFDKRGLVTTKGGGWRVNAVRSMLTNATVAGKRQYRGAIVGPGNWEPILDEATWANVRARLGTSYRVEADYPRLVTRQHRAARRYLLTRFMVCGECGAPLGASAVKSEPTATSEAVAMYLCRRNYGGRACLAVHAEPTEEWFTEQLLAHLTSPAFRAALAADDPEDAARQALASRLAAVNARRTELADLWSEGSLTSSEWETARAKLAVTEADLTAELEALRPVGPAGLLDPDAIRADWATMELGEQRRIIELAVKTIIVRKVPPPQRSRYFSPSRIEIVWRHRSK